MTQLTNKEILYEPMKELHDKYPAWLEKHAKELEKTDKGELERYREQQTLVGEIVGRFERKGYSDEDEGDREFIVERMQKVSSLFLNCEELCNLVADGICRCKQRVRHHRISLAICRLRKKRLEIWRVDVQHNDP